VVQGIGPEFKAQHGKEKQTNKQNPVYQYNSPYLEVLLQESHSEK
jgi:hypothetical protein